MNIYNEEKMVNKKILTMLLLPLFLVQCATYYKFFKTESEYYTEGEKVILAQTTAAIGFRSGFDPDLKLDYVYSHSAVKDNAAKKKQKMIKALQAFKPGEVTAFYEKIFRLKRLIEYTMEEAKADEDWNDYTHIKKYVLPSFAVYFNLLEKSVLEVVPAYVDSMKKRKAVIEAEVKLEFD